MSDRTIETIVFPDPQPGTGILHPFPTPELPQIDPFVFLDSGAPRQLGTGEIFVGPHPHRGVQPVSLVFRADIEHRDSLGNHRRVSSGGMQWLVAGRGAMHEEVLRGDADGVFHMAQLWVNVPASLKMAAPEHHAVGSEEVPVITDLGVGASIRLYAGELGDVIGPAPLPTPVMIGHVVMEPGAEVRLPVREGWSVGISVVAGSVDVYDRQDLSPGCTISFADDGDSVTGGSQAGGEVLFMAGEPIGEPVAMGGGFVMNTESEIRIAFADYQAGAMGELEASR
ncbi:MAG: pirin family protein [Acidimicrobiales bacterium]